MCPAWYYLTGVVALRTRSKEFEERGEVARETPCDMNVENPMVFEGFSMRARADFSEFVGEKVVCFHTFY